MTTSTDTERPPARSTTGQRLRMAFQPVVELRGGRVVGHEALLRVELGREWAGPSAAFAEAAVAGRSLELELLAIGLAIARFDELPAGSFLAVNAAPSTILAEEFSRTVAHVDLRRIVIEITENEQIDDYRALVAVLDRLRRRGARVAVDDAGAGLASLRHVIELRPDIVKLDVSLIDRVCHHSVQRALVRALTQFTTEIGAVLVAEGIEDLAQVAVLRRLGVRFGQGFALGRPGPLGTEG